MSTKAEIVQLARPLYTGQVPARLGRGDGRAVLRQYNLAEGDVRPRWVDACCDEHILTYHAQPRVTVWVAKRPGGVEPAGVGGPVALDLAACVSALNRAGIWAAGGRFLSREGWSQEVRYGDLVRRVCEQHPGEPVRAVAARFSVPERGGTLVQLHTNGVAFVDDPHAGCDALQVCAMTLSGA